MRRIGFVGAVALLSAIACDSVLDIEDPKTRPDTPAGEGGEPTLVTAGTSSGGTSSGGGGSASDGGVAGEGPLLTTPGGNGGEGGDPTPRDCETGEGRCTDLTPEVCDAAGRWVPNPEEADGECALLCVAGQCAECSVGEKRCSICEEGAQDCLPSLPQTCVDGAWRDADAPCQAYCDVGTGSCVRPPSCADVNFLGTDCEEGVSCCTSLLVPGGTFFRNFDNDEFSDKTLPATLSSFYLDKFEVTVGRFKQFLLQYEALSTILSNGAGKSAHIADDQGWNGAQVLPSKTDLLTALQDCSGTTWSETSIPDDDRRPVNCVTFELAYAFCIWDGGRLPTETEWNLAAAGGSEQRVYPWPAPLTGPPISADFTNYGFANPGPVMVGLTPAGDGRFGQSDLAGNVAEWTLDYWGDPPAECSDCLNTTTGAERVVRGGYFEQDETGAKVSFRTSSIPEAGRSTVGFRCARDLR